MAWRQAWRKAWARTNGQSWLTVWHGARHGTCVTMGDVDYDLTRLNQFGRKHKRLRDEMEALRPELAEEIRAAHAAGVAQVDIAARSGYTRDQVRQICLPPERRRTRARATA